MCWWVKRATKVLLNEPGVGWLSNRALQVTHRLHHPNVPHFHIKAPWAEVDLVKPHIQAKFPNLQHDFHASWRNQGYLTVCYKMLFNSAKRCLLPCVCSAQKQHLELCLGSCLGSPSSCSRNMAVSSVPAFQMPRFGFPLQSPKIRNDFLNGKICFRSSLPVPETILQASAAQLKEQNYDQ